MITIFHVDDSPEEIVLSRAHLKNFLEDFEYKAYTTAVKALEDLESNPCDLIISDIQMPFMDGMQFLRKVREKRPRLPFIFLTGQGNEEMAVEAFRNGADDYYTKDESFAHYQRLANCISRLHSAYLEKVRHQQAKIALEENESLLQTILDATPVGIGLVKNRKLVWGSPVMYEMLGYTPGELLNIDARTIYHTEQEYLAAGESLYKDLYEIGHKSHETRIRTRDGEERTVLITIRVVDKNKPERGQIVAFNDITERRQNQRRIRFQADLLDFVQQAVIATDATGQVVYFNPFAEKLYGWKRADALGRTLKELAINADSSERAAEIGSKVSAGEVWSGEYPVQNKDGKVFDALVSLSPYYSPGGEYAGTIGISQDISSQKKMRVERDTATERLNLAVNSAHIGIWELDVINNRLIWDERMYELYGLSPENFGHAYEAWQAGLHPDDLERGAREVELALAGEKDFDTEFRVVTPEGEVRHIRAFANITRDAEGNPLKMIGVNYDITAKKLALEQLRESESRYRHLFDTAPVGIFQTTLGGRWLVANQQLAEMLGYESSADLINAMRDIPRTLYKNPADREAMVKALKRDRFITDYEFEGRKSDGSSIWIKMDARLHKATPEAEETIQGFAVDISTQVQAEAVASYSQRNFRSILRNASIIGVSLDENGCVSFVNDFFLDLSGYQRDELEGEFWFDMFLPEEIRQEVFGVFKKTMNDQRIEDAHTRYENEIILKDGQRRTISWTNVSSIDPSGRLVGINSIGVDITERTRYERQLEESRDALELSEKKYRSYTELAPLGIFVSDETGTYVDVNSAAQKMTGYSRQEMLEMKISELDITPEDESISAFEELLNSGHLQAQRVLRSKNGEPVPVELSAVKLSETRFMALCLDISDRQQALDELNIRSRAIDSALVGIAFGSLDNKIEYANPAFLEMFGFSDQDEIVGQDIAFFNTGKQDVTQVLKSLHEKGVTNGAAEARKKDGSTIMVMYSAQLLHDAQGEPVRHFVSAVDVTALHEREQQLLETGNQLEMANKELDFFAHSVSHDLRAPLRQVEGFSKLLAKELDESGDPEIGKIITMLLQAVRNMDTLLNDYLRLARANISGIKKADIDLTGMAKSVVTELRDGEGGRNVEIKIEEGMHAHSDAALLRSVLQNLIGNAYKYTSRRETAKIEIGSIEENGGKTYFVRDNGTGFDMADHDKLFKPFKRLRGSEEYPGSGVGLAIIQRAINRLGGKVWAEGTPGEGAVFYFQI